MRLAIVPVISAMDERNKRLFNARMYSLDSQIELYQRHNAFIRQVVPKDKLLEFDPKEGYDRLCEFLNVPVPTDERGNKLDFPHVNDSESMQRGLKFATALGFAIWGAVIGGAYFMVRRIGLSIT